MPKLFRPDPVAVTEAHYRVPPLTDGPEVFHGRLCRWVRLNTAPKTALAVLIPFAQSPYGRNPAWWVAHKHDTDARAAWEAIQAIAAQGQLTFDGIEVEHVS